jgi:preprotein translocase subunit SecG
LTKATTVAAVLFMITSLSLTILYLQPGGSSVIHEGARQNQQQQQQQQQPAQQPPAQPQQQQSAPAPAPVTPSTPEKK